MTMYLFVLLLSGDEQPKLADREFLSYGKIYTGQEERHKVKAELTFDLDGGKFNELVWTTV